MENKTDLMVRASLFTLEDYESYKKEKAKPGKSYVIKAVKDDRK